MQQRKRCNKTRKKKKIGSRFLLNRQPHWPILYFFPSFLSHPPRKHLMLPIALGPPLILITPAKTKTRFTSTVYLAALYSSAPFQQIPQYQGYLKDRVSDIKSTATQRQSSSVYRKSSKDTWEMLLHSESLPAKLPHSKRTC